MEFFERSRPAAGERSVAVRLGPLEIEIGGLDRDLAQTLARRYAPYAAQRAQAPDALRVQLRLARRDYFFDPPQGIELVQMRLACDGSRVRYLSYRVAGWFDMVGGRGLLLLGRGEYEPVLRAVENYVRAAVAWQAVSRGGALVHAASAVLDDRAYLFSASRAPANRRWPSAIAGRG